ncbi:MAG: L-seryl-tRNA(Sec) selenium transferase [Alphaproteobacteria bacterium]|nr:L-seryl-tRNA(Sec) selenium transferase [Alphaproteobacteria bacterium]
METSERLRALPRVDAVLDDAALAGWPRPLVREVAREVLDATRAAIRRGEAAPDVVAHVVERLTALTTPALHRVINATGVVVHTNLGRAPWAPEAVAAVAAIAGGYTNLELRLDDGSRGGRLDGVTERLCRLTGAQAALVVNNAAAAVLLALTALARDRDVIVSRGELVEIGGSFRVPDVVAAGGARLRAVGTTNRTRASDYADAIEADTAVLLRVHPSNFRMEGFVAGVDTPTLAALARERGLTLVYDLGSGALRERGDEPDVRTAVAQGAHVVAFSGDKLLGGPQAGLLVGDADVIHRLRRHPLYRALRVDKAILAALDATLLLHLQGRATPVDAMLDADPEALATRAQVLATGLRARGAVVKVVALTGVVGGGALPETPVPSSGLALTVRSPDGAARALRTGQPAIVARIHDDRLVLDLRTVDPADDPTLAARLAAVVVSG